MAVVGLVCSDEADRQRLSLLAGEAGHAAHAAGRLTQALELLRELRPRLMVVVDSPDCDAQVLVRELSRAAPLLPIVVLLKTRDAGRAVELMKTGAAEVMPTPWTQDALHACLSKALRQPGTSFSLTRARRRRGPIYALAVLVFFAAAFGRLAWRRRQAQQEAALHQRTYWDLPYRHPAGMAFDGKDFWIADWYSQSLYVHEPSDLAIVRIVHFPDEMPIAVAFAADAVWSVSASGRIVRRMRDAALTPLTAYKDAAPDTLGMAFDGLYLWTCDSRTKMIHKRIIDSDLTIVASYRYPGGTPAALAFDGRDLWSLDSENHELIRLDLEHPSRATARVSLPEYADGRYRAVGLAYADGRFWTLGERLPRDSGPARLFREAAIP